MGIHTHQTEEKQKQKAMAGPRVDDQGVEMVMRPHDYAADGLGQFGLGIMANIVGQLTYFYTDKVGISVMSVGVVMAIAKFVDAVANLFIGHIIDRSKGGDAKYYRWIGRMILPAGFLVFLLFTVPKAADPVRVAYALVTNILLTAVIYCLAATPFAAVMVARVKSQKERGTMGILRAAANYFSGMVIAIITIPVTNLLGGNQAAWIKYGVILALIVALALLVCWLNGRRAHFATVSEEQKEDTADSDLPLWTALRLLFHNRYWVIVLFFNIITNVVFGIFASGSAYYTKWIFGNDNLTGVIGLGGMLASLAGFAVSPVLIRKLGVRRTILYSLALAIASYVVLACFADNLPVFICASLLSTFAQVPMMSLYGVMQSMAIDWNEHLYGVSLVGIGSGGIGLASALGGGLGSLLLSIFLQIGGYDPHLKVATTSMRWSIYGFSIYLPIVLFVVTFFIFRGFDLEKRLAELREKEQAGQTEKKTADTRDDDASSSDTEVSD